MKTLKQFLIIFTAIFLMTACSNNNKTSSNNDEVFENIKRPEKSDKKAKELLGKFDRKVVLVMRSVRELKSSVRKGNKVTPTIEKNIAEMINEAKNAQNNLKPLLNKLSDDDFGLYERDKDRLRSRETKFEELKQNK